MVGRRGSPRVVDVHQRVANENSYRNALGVLTSLEAKALDSVLLSSLFSFGESSLHKPGSLPPPLPLQDQDVPFPPHAEHIAGTGPADLCAAASDVHRRVPGSDPVQGNVSNHFAGLRQWSTQKPWKSHHLLNMRTKCCLMLLTLLWPPFGFQKEAQKKA